MGETIPSPGGLVPPRRGGVIVRIHGMTSGSSLGAVNHSRSHLVGFKKGDSNSSIRNCCSLWRTTNTLCVGLSRTGRSAAGPTLSTCAVNMVSVRSSTRLGALCRVAASSLRRSVSKQNGRIRRFGNASVFSSSRTESRSSPPVPVTARSHSSVSTVKSSSLVSVVRRIVRWVTLRVSTTRLKRSTVPR